MLVVINGERRQVRPGTTIAAVVAALPGTPEGRGVAVALDGEVIPRGEWERAQLAEGTHVEVVMAVQGG